MERNEKQKKADAIQNHMPDRKGVKNARWNMKVQKLSFVTFFLLPVNIPALD